MHRSEKDTIDSSRQGESFSTIVLANVLGVLLISIGFTAVSAITQILALRVVSYCLYFVSAIFAAMTLGIFLRRQREQRPPDAEAIALASKLEEALLVQHGVFWLRAHHGGRVDPLT